MSTEASTDYGKDLTLYGSGYSSSEKLDFKPNMSGSDIPWFKDMLPWWLLLLFNTNFQMLKQMLLFRCNCKTTEDTFKTWYFI